MVTIFATLGYVPQSVLPSLRDQVVEELVVFASTKEERVEAAVKKVREHCSMSDIPFQRVRIARPYDLEYVAKVIATRLDASKDKEVVFNITGGTKVMAAAALIICFLRGIPTEYAKEGTMEVIRLPLMKIDTSTQLTSRQREIVGFLLRQKDQRADTKQLMKATGLKKSGLSSHIIRLKKKGLVTVEPGRGSNKGNIVTAIPSLSILMFGLEK